MIHLNQVPWCYCSHPAVPWVYTVDGAPGHWEVTISGELYYSPERKRVVHLAQITDPDRLLDIASKIHDWENKK